MRKFNVKDRVIIAADYSIANGKIGSVTGWALTGGVEHEYCVKLDDGSHFWIIESHLVPAPAAEDPYHFHIWRKYVGFTDIYEYCECGEKRR